MFLKARENGKTRKKRGQRINASAGSNALVPGKGESGLAKYTIQETNKTQATFRPKAG